MKKIYSKILAATFVAATSAFGAWADEVVVLNENFDNLEAVTDAGVHKYGKNPWTGKDAEGVSYQPNFTDLTTAGFADDLNGWTSRTSWLYTCQGYIRFSKTGYGGDAVSPKFTALTQPTDVKLSWQGIGYSSEPKANADGSYKSGEKHDYQYYCVAVLGAGEIDGATKTIEVAYKDADKKDITVNAAVIEIPSTSFITIDTLQAWSFEGTKNTLTIKGATAETQVVFMSVKPNFSSAKAAKTTDYVIKDMPAATDAPHGVNVGANRVILDNVKVTYETVPTAIADVTAAKQVKAYKVIENGQIYIIAGDKKYNVMGAEVK